VVPHRNFVGRPVALPPRSRQCCERRQVALQAHNYQWLEGLVAARPPCSRELKQPAPALEVDIGDDLASCTDDEAFEDDTDHHMATWPKDVRQEANHRETVQSGTIRAAPLVPGSRYQPVRASGSIQIPTSLAIQTSGTVGDVRNHVPDTGFDGCCN